MATYFNFNVSFHNDTSTEHDGGYHFITIPTIVAIPVSIIDAVMILFGATINFAVITMVISHHRSLKIMDLFILNLCLSDFASSVFYQPLVIIRLLARRELSGVLAVVFKMVTFTCLLADCAAIFLVAFDKYLGIRFPFRYPTYFNKQKVLVIIACAWATAVAIGLIFATYKGAEKTAGIIYGMSLIIMFVTTTALQIASFIIAKRHEGRIKEIGKVFANGNSTTTSRRADQVSSSAEVTPQMAQFSVENSKPEHPFTSKAARTITLLTMVFIISWLPQIILNVYFIITSDRKTFFGLIYLFVAFQQFHVCVNPFIYVFRTRCIRDKFFTNNT